MAVSDGVTNAAPVAGSSQSWDSVLEQGVSDVGFDPSATMGELDAQPDVLSSQGTPAASSEPDTVAAPSVPTGDVGTSTPAPDSPAPDSDPLANATPFTYAVGAETKTLDGTYRIPGEGIIVPEDRVAQVEEAFVNAGRLGAEVQQVRDQLATYDRLTQWTTRGPDGKEQLLTGPQGLAEQRVLLGRSLAALTTISEIFQSDESFKKYISVVYDTDGQPVDIVRNAAAFDLLKERTDNAAYRREQEIRQWVGKASAPPPPPEPVASDYADPTIAKLVSDHKLTNLTSADLQFLKAEFPRYVIQENGKPAIDARFIDVLKHHDAQRAEQVKAASAASTASTFNQGMQKGRNTPKPAPRPAPPAPASAPPKVGKQAAWDTVLSQAMAEISPA